MKQYERLTCMQFPSSFNGVKLNIGLYMKMNEIYIFFNIDLIEHWMSDTGLGEPLV
jgi:hypothetical protein